MALDFTFKSSFPIQQYVQAYQQRALLEQQKEEAKRQAKQQNMNTLLNALTTAASISRMASQNKTEALARSQQQSEMQGNRDLAVQMTGNRPISSMVPGATYNQTAEYVPTPGIVTPNISTGKLQSALVRANPAIAAQQIAKAQWEDPYVSEAKKQNVILKNLAINQKTGEQATTGSTVDTMKEALRKSMPDLKIPDDIPLNQLEKISKAVSLGDLGSARKTMADVNKARYSTSGIEPALKVEENRIASATHGLKLIDQAYDPKTDTYDVKALMAPELNMVLARMFSPNGVVGIEAQKAIEQASLKGDIGKMYQYVTGDTSSDLSNVMPQDIAKLFVKSIDRQAMQAEQNRDTYNKNKSDALGIESIKPGLSYSEQRKKSKIFGKSSLGSGRLIVNGFTVTP